MEDKTDYQVVVTLADLLESQLSRASASSSLPPAITFDEKDELL
jgi:hypothetical protein